jgi:hypothetical protein
MTNPTYMGSPPPGYTALPSNGGVRNAVYLYPGITITPWEFLDFRTAVLAAWTDQDLVDPYATALNGDVAVSPLGGKTGGYLGTEYDLGMFSRFEFSKGGPVLKAFIQFGIFFPGSAFKNRGGGTFESVKLVNTGLQFQW